MSETGGRHELKHYINFADMAQLRARLPSVMRRDTNADAEGGYRIRSLYFDNYSDKALREKLDGVDDREKFRLRFYNDTPSFIRLEKKSKRNGICFKQSAVVSFEAALELLRGNADKLRESCDPLQVELYAKMKYQQLRPKNIVDYRREAFTYPAGNVRVTMDYDIRTSFTPESFLNAQYVSVPIPSVTLLEVKYDSYLPEIIRGVTTLSSRRETAFSKYAATRII